MNNRANIMYFIEHLCDLAQRENHLEFVRMIQRDILRVIDAVAPSDGSGAANLKVVRRVLQALQQKQILVPQTVQELEDCLKDRDNAVAPASEVAANGVTARTSTPHGGKLNGVRLDKRQVEQRIEEDRERHKRLRESVWVVEDEQEEMDDVMAEAGEVDDDDILAGEEDQAERKDTR
jgi:CTD kinase subunit gamma